MSADTASWIGSYWHFMEYDLIQAHLVSKKYGSNEKQYALDHGYPKLIHVNPHDRKIEELKDSDENEFSPPHPVSQLTSPSTFSLIDAPTDQEGTCEEGPSITTRLAKGLGFWTSMNASVQKRKGKSKAVSSESQINNTDGWSLVGYNDL
ncbi:hypothetical protein AAF712_011904 [Marasmius tenuissimus]|uniref:Uncharacterized protein n=1 Tax=Marasmius tenuissimus TaxID=585030 RepID=A0ABR2ZI77_9AGAR